MPPSAKPTTAVLVCSSARSATADPNASGGTVSRVIAEDDGLLSAPRHPVTAPRAARAGIVAQPLISRTATTAWVTDAGHRGALHHQLPREPVPEHTAEEQGDDLGQRERGDDQAELGRIATQVEDREGERDRRDRVAEPAGGRAGHEIAVVTEAQRPEALALRRGRLGRHRAYLIRQRTISQSREP